MGGGRSGNADKDFVNDVVIRRRAIDIKDGTIRQPTFVQVVKDHHEDYHVVTLSFRANVKRT